MSIDLSSYYNYLNNISSSLTDSINSVSTSNYNITDTEDTSSDFEQAFLSMINQSQAAYDKIAELEENGTLTTGSASSIGTTDTTDSASELYNSLTQILDSYESMKSQSQVPKSIKESLLDLLNQNDSDSDSNNITSDYQSDLDVDSLIKKALSQL